MIKDMYNNLKKIKIYNNIEKIQQSLEQKKEKQTNILY